MDLLTQWIFCREPADCSIGYFAVSSFHTCAPDVMQRRQEQLGHGRPQILDLVHV